MNPVGDAGNGNIFHRIPGPDLFPHIPRNLSMQSAHPVGMGGQPEGQHGHAKILLVVCGLLTAKSQKDLEGNSKRLHVILKICVHKVW